MDETAGSHAARVSPGADSDPARYMSGFGNEFASESLPGILEPGRNNPQRVARGLYAEQLSGTAFTAPRAENRRTWLYRIRPSVTPGAWTRVESPRLFAAPFPLAHAIPAPMRWSPFPLPGTPADFVDGLFTVGGGGDVRAQSGLAIHWYAANRSMERRVMCNADGEMLVVPQLGALTIRTETGVLSVVPGEIAVLPRGMRFSVALRDTEARGYVCENYGAMFRRPELGPIGANGLANPRDFLVPVASFEDRAGPFEILTKYAGRLWRTEAEHSPFDVVAWHGNHVPYKYDLARFVVFGSISVDSPDPSISTVLTSPSSTPGVANADFVAFAPRWQVMEATFRPPFFHRNVMSEFMGSIRGIYEGKATGFVPGGASLHNRMTPHGPDVSVFTHASGAALAPAKLDNTLSFMFETQYPIDLTPQAAEASWLQGDYAECWREFPRQFEEGSS